MSRSRLPAESCCCCDKAASQCACDLETVTMWIENNPPEFECPLCLALVKRREFDSGFTYRMMRDYWTCCSDCFEQ